MTIEGLLRSRRRLAVLPRAIHGEVALQRKQPPPKPNRWEVEVAKSVGSSTVSAERFGFRSHLERARTGHARADDLSASFHDTRGSGISDAEAAEAEARGRRRLEEQREEERRVEEARLAENARKRAARKEKASRIRRKHEEALARAAQLGSPEVEVIKASAEASFPREGPEEQAKRDADAIRAVLEARAAREEQQLRRRSEHEEDLLERSLAWSPSRPPPILPARSYEDTAMRGILNGCKDAVIKQLMAAATSDEKERDDAALCLLLMHAAPEVQPEVEASAIDDVLLRTLLPEGGDGALLGPGQQAAQDARDTAAVQALLAQPPLTSGAQAVMDAGAVQAIMGVPHAQQVAQTDRDALSMQAFMGQLSPAPPVRAEMDVAAMQAIMGLPTAAGAAHGDRDTAAMQSFMGQPPLLQPSAQADRDMGAMQAIMGVPTAVGAAHGDRDTAAMQSFMGPPPLQPSMQAARDMGAMQAIMELTPAHAARASCDTSAVQAVLDTRDAAAVQALMGQPLMAPAPQAVLDTRDAAAVQALMGQPLTAPAPQALLDTRDAAAVQALMGQPLTAPVPQAAVAAAPGAVRAAQDVGDAASIRDLMGPDADLVPRANGLPPPQSFSQFLRSSRENPGIQRFMGAQRGAAGFGP